MKEDIKMKKTEISRIELAREIRELFVKDRNIQEYSKIDDNFLWIIILIDMMKEIIN